MLVIYSLMHNRKGKLREDGTTAVQVRAYHDKKHKYFSNGINVEPKFWDDKRKQVSQRHTTGRKGNHLFEHVNNSLKLSISHIRKPIGLKIHVPSIRINNNIESLDQVPADNAHLPSAYCALEKAYGDV
jgi:hypothetical protein